MVQARVKRVAILFSGGDSPGMNPLLRVFVRLALNRHGIELLGIKDGFMGLVRTCDRRHSFEVGDDDLLEQISEQCGQRGVEDSSLDIVLLDHRSVSGIVDRGGIILGSSRCPDFREEETRRDAIQLLTHVLEVDAVVVVGGRGSLQAAAELAAESGLLVIGIPATIDNDFQLTERSLGFDTAVNTIVDCVRLVNDTAMSHHRIMVLETMGREHGQLAQTAALASGAEIVVTPERTALGPGKLDAIAKRIERSFDRGRSHAIVLVTEGVAFEPPNPAGPSKALAEFLQRHFDNVAIKGSFRHVDVRNTVLGHLQRGGSPSSSDRLLAADFAEVAWNIIASPRRRRSGVLGFVQGRVKWQAFDAEPLADRETEMVRIYKLQKDSSDFCASDTLAPRKTGTKATPRKRRTRK